MVLVVASESPNLPPLTVIGGGAKFAPIWMAYASRMGTLFLGVTGGLTSMLEIWHTSSDVRFQLQKFFFVNCWHTSAGARFQVSEAGVKHI
jgi:hypothetical protein